MPMTPKRLRLIAKIIADDHTMWGDSRRAIAQELEDHATELESFRDESIKLREPGTVFTDLERQAKERK